jgi:riboflavin biosynthesis pyrimidine reductase
MRRAFAFESVVDSLSAHVQTSRPRLHHFPRRLRCRRQPDPRTTFRPDPRRPARLDARDKNRATFHFVTGGIHDALARAREAANGKDVRLGGGVSTVRQYLEAKLIDELHVVISPIIIGAGEHLFANLDLRKLGYELTEHVTTKAATHVVFMKRS